MKLCLVTGAFGFCGSHMVELLVKKGYKVRATDLEDHERGVNSDVIKKLNVEFVPADLTKPETLKKAVKDVEYVFHIAAHFSYSSNWQELFKVNVDGTRNLCEALVKYGKVEKFVLWSSGSVYGMPVSGEKMVKSYHYPNPTNLYGKSKLLQEYTALEYLDEYNLPVIIVRCSPIYGPRNIYGLFQLWSGYSKFPAVVMPRSFPVRFPYVHVEDVCNSALFLAENERRYGNVFNIVDDGDYDVYDFFKMVSKFLNKKFIKLPISYKVFNRINAVASVVFGILSRIIPIKILRYLRETVPYATVDYNFTNKKLKKIGYQFQYPSIEKGMEETIEWLKENNLIKIKDKVQKKK